MSYKVVTPVASEPVTLAEARLHLRLASDETAEDTIITALISTAREWAEHYTARALAPQTLELALNAFPPCNGPIQLDMPPVTAVSSVKYTDLDGNEQTMDAATWYFSPYGSAREIATRYGVFWPITQAVKDAVRVQYVTGYSTGTLPKSVKSAILLIVGHLYENRQEVVNDLRTVAIEIPMGAQSLLDTIKVWAV